MELASPLHVEVGLNKIGRDLVDPARAEVGVLASHLLEEERLSANAGGLAGLGQWEPRGAEAAGVVQPHKT